MNRSNSKDIFSVEDGILVINKDYVRGIKEFRTLLERDKGSDKDADGRKKFMAYKELFYIYMVASLFSYPNRSGSNEKECHKMAVKEAQLDENYRPDKVVKEAIEKYREIQAKELPTLGAISTVLKGLKLADVICQTMIESMEEIIEANRSARKRRQELKDNIKPGEPDNLANEMLAIEGLTSRLDKIVSISNKIPDQIGTLELLEERLKKDQSASEALRGGKEKGSRADPRSRRDEDN